MILPPMETRFLANHCWTEHDRDLGEPVNLSLRIAEFYPVLNLLSSWIVDNQLHGMTLQLVLHEGKLEKILGDFYQRGYLKGRGYRALTQVDDGTVFSRNRRNYSGWPSPQLLSQAYPLRRSG